MNRSNFSVASYVASIVEFEDFFGSWGFDEDRYYHCPCAGRGINCSALWTYDFIYDYITSFLRTFLSVFVVVISFTHVGAETFKYYTLNLYLFCTPFDVTLLVELCLKVVNLYREVDCAWRTFYEVQQYMMFLISCEYKVLSFLVVVEVYMLYCYPLSYGRIFKKRRWPIFLTVALLSNALSALQVSVIDTWSSRKSGAHQPIYVFLGSISLLLCILNLIVTFMAAKAVIRRRRVYNSNGRKELVTFLVYCAPSSILGLPSAVLSVNRILCVVAPDIPMCVPQFFIYMEKYVEDLRTTIISLSTITALPSYRRAALQIFSGHFRTFRNKFRHSTLVTEIK